MANKPENLKKREGIYHVVGETALKVVGETGY